jgi:hypothetical protein
MMPVAACLFAGCLAAPTTVGKPCADPVASNPCQAVSPLTNEPNVTDGVVECDVIPQAATPTWSLDGSPPAELGLSWAAAYRPNGLYVYAELRKPSVFTAPKQQNDPGCGDAFHLYVDDDGRFRSAPEYDAPGTRHIVCTAPFPSQARCFQYERRITNGSPDPTPFSSPRFNTFQFDGGLRLEAFVLPTDLGLSDWKLLDGGLIGLNLSTTAVRPSDVMGDNCYGRAGELFAHVLDGRGALDSRLPRTTVAAFCTPRLAESTPVLWEGGCASISGLTPAALILLMRRRRCAKAV